MSSFQFRTLAVCSWLVALCFLIACAAYYEEYTLFRDGTSVRGTVTVIEPHDGRVRVGLRYNDHGTQQDTHAWAEDVTGLAPGATVDLLLHQNNGQPLLARSLSEKLPTPAMLLGLVASIALGVYLWTVPTRQARKRAQRTSPLDALTDAARRSRNVALGVGTFLCITGGFFAVVPFYDRESGTAGSVCVWALAAVTLAIGVAAVASGIRLRDPRNNEIMDLVLNHPERIAWFYVRQVTTQGVQASETLTVDLWKTDGKSVAVALVREDLEPVLAEIAARAPHARQGYDPETEKLYRERPDRWQPRA